MSEKDDPQTAKVNALEARVVELEVRVTYQDQVIADLDGVVREFTKRAEKMAAEIRSTREAIVRMRETGPANDPPPHY